MDDEATEVEIGHERDAVVVIGAVQLQEHDSGRFPIRVSAPGLAASGWIEFEAWSGGVSRLAAFFAELATNWRGWEGSIDWRDSGATVEFSATHNRIGLVVLHVTVRSLPGDGGWRVVVDVPVEPGALSPIADRLARMSEPPR
jgi:hypothetical protein